MKPRNFFAWAWVICFCSVLFACGTEPASGPVDSYPAESRLALERCDYGLLGPWLYADCARRNKLRYLDAAR